MRPDHFEQDFLPQKCFPMFSQLVQSVCIVDRQLNERCLIKSNYKDIILEIICTHCKIVHRIGLSYLALVF